MDCKLFRSDEIPNGVFDGAFDRVDIWSSNVYFDLNEYPRMVDHGRNHAKNVTRLAVRLASMCTPRLSNSEWRALVASAMLHDIGMSMNREHHAQESARLIVKEHKTFQLGYCEAELVALIAKAHSSFDINSMDDGFSIDAEVYRSKMLAAILSLADACDTGWNRLDGLEYGMQRLAALKATQSKDIEDTRIQIHHIKRHLAVKEVSIDDDSIVFVPAPNADPEMVEVSRSDLKNSLGRVKAILDKNGFPCCNLVDGKGVKPANTEKLISDWHLPNYRDYYDYDDHQLVSNPLNGKSMPQVLVVDNTKQRMSFQFVISEDSFQVPSCINDRVKSSTKEMTKLAEASGKSLYNADNLRVTSIITRGERVTINLQPAKYYDYLGTNLSLDHKQYGTTLRELISRKQRHLEDLSESQLCNLFGINCLVITSDNLMPIQVRSHNVIVRPGEKCSSYSGTLDMNEENLLLAMQDDRPLDHTLLLRREGCEEINITLRRQSLKILGITRELVRGGQPEIFCAAEVNISGEEIRLDWPQASDARELTDLKFIKVPPYRTENIEYSDIKDEVVKQLRDLDCYNSLVSVPLLTNIALWLRYIELYGSMAFEH